MQYVNVTSCFWITDPASLGERTNISPKRKNALKANRKTALSNVFENNQPVTITIEANHNNSQLCPVTAVHSHLENHSRVDGPLFQNIGGKTHTHRKIFVYNHVVYKLNEEMRIYL
jgi:hypothetical protein